VLFLPLLYTVGIAFNWYGELEDGGQIESHPVSAEIRARQIKKQFEAAKKLGIADPKQILFGDLHVHTTFSSDASECLCRWSRAMARTRRQTPAILPGFVPHWISGRLQTTQRA
jgi:hypothetical protein